MFDLAAFDSLHLKIRTNRWYWFFYIFCRLALAFGFFAAGMVKIIGERFASGLGELHPMGAYLEALYQTGYYYTFIGIAQIIASILLLIPRTVLLGALLYLPIITNIFILSFALRFEGSYVTSPLMFMANIYILIWHGDKLKYILPFRKNYNEINEKRPKIKNNKFPLVFFCVVLLCIVGIIFFAQYGNEVMPRNSYKDCTEQFNKSDNQKAGAEFCECIHKEGYSLTRCLKKYEQKNNLNFN